MTKDTAAMPLPLDLGGGLVLKIAQSPRDLDRIAELHGLAFDAGAATATHALAAGYPGLRAEDFCYVEDTASGELVSSVCLVPTVWHYEGIPLNVGELGIVATHPEYRQRGLVRSQMRWFESQLHARGCHLASIQGIPFFYRQFGYDYAIPLGPACELGPEAVPEALEADAGASARRATAADVPLLLDLLAATQATLGVSLERSAAAWLYQDDPRRADMDALDTYVTCEADRPTGYFRIQRYETREHHREGALVAEASPLPYRSCLVALRVAKAVATGREYRQAIRLALPPSSPLLRVATSLGGRPIEPYAWQVRIPDAVRFLQAIAPVLERRLASSFFAGYSSFLRIDLYSDTIQMDFEAGRLHSISALGPIESRAVRLPWWAAWQLWLGHRSQAELTAWYPDAHVEPALQPLIDVLFPKRESWVFPTL